MDIDEHFRHSDRRQCVQLLGHLRDAREAINLAAVHVKLVKNSSDSCKAIDNNVEALRAGLDETINLCAKAMDEFKQEMTEPDAKPAPISARIRETNLTPLQRALTREGVLSINTVPLTHTKQELRTPKILKFTLKQKQPKYKDRKTKDNPPL